METKVIKKNIFNLFNQATTEEITNGIQWYPISNSFCKTISLKYQVPISKVIAITAAFSPLKSWSTNQKMVIQFFENRKSLHTKSQTQKVMEIFLLILDNYTEEELDDKIMKILNGKKTSSFYHNIKYPYTSSKVTIDSHIIKGIVNSNIKTLSPKNYVLVEKTILDTSKKLNYKGLHLQAILWLTHKRLKASNNVSNHLYYGK